MNDSVPAEPANDGAGARRSLYSGCPYVALRPARLRSVLHRLMAGEGKKQAASALGITQSTVHQYITSIYRHFGVGSHSELFARIPIGPLAKSNDGRAARKPPVRRENPHHIIRNLMKWRSATGEENPRDLGR